MAGVTRIQPAARPGRPRSEDSRQAILTAALELTAEAGYAALSVDGIAGRAGTGKQTIYRWWPSKDDVLLEALAAKVDVHVDIADRGSYRADLRAFLEASFALGRHPQIAIILRALMARAQIDTSFGERFRDSFLYRRRDALAVLVQRARDRGDLPPALRPGTVADIIFGVIWYRVLATGEPPDAELVTELIVAVSGPPQWSAGRGAAGTS
jgi:AcrR family transcriptional regulator